MTGEEVRREVRAWLEANWNPELSLVEWRNRLADSGWVLCNGQIVTLTMEDGSLLSDVATPNLVDRFIMG